RLLALERVFGDHDQPLWRSEETDRGHREQADGAGTLHDHHVLTPRASPQRCVYTAGERFEQHSRLVGQAFGHGVELTLVGDQDLAPTAPGAGAVAGLKADLQGSLRHVLAQAGPAFRAAWADGCDAADTTPQGRLDHHPRAIVEFTN